MKQFGIGQPVRRVDDPHFIASCGAYLDDLSRPRRAYVHMPRSPQPVRASVGIHITATSGVLAHYAG